MRLIQGKLLQSKDSITYSSLQNMVRSTLEKPPLSPVLVMEACDKIADRILEGGYDKQLEAVKNLTQSQLTQINLAARLMKKDSLCYRMETELGKHWKEGILSHPQKPKLLQRSEVIENKQYYPLGVLFHIAAGNLEVLPFYSVIEGLLTGNINLLKIPGNDNGITIQLLTELIEAEPLLAEYVYVFDTPSYNLNARKKLANLADAIVVWGGDTTIQAVRSMAKPNQKILEWGHKVSFAYLSGLSPKQEETVLTRLAHHIYTTKQVLCSSCQGIYLDTDKNQELNEFSQRFQQILEKVGTEYSKNSTEIQAMVTMKLYTQKLEDCDGNIKIYRGNQSSVMSCKDSDLMASLQFGNCWVKAMPRNKIIATLYPYRGYLQTAALCCDEKDRDALSHALACAGITRITREDNMSRMLGGETHDGRYALQHYVRIVEL